MGTRLKNWHIPFAEEIQKPRAFEWGKADCVMFCLEMLSHYTSNPLGKQYYGTYSKLSQGVRFLKKWGTEGRTLNSNIISLFDKQYERIAVSFATQGDIVGFYSEEAEKANKQKESGFTVGLMCNGFGRFVVHNGYQDIPREQLDMAWRV